MKIPRLLQFVVLLLICCGCAGVVSFHEIHTKADKVKLIDGVQEDEADLLAQKFILSKGLEDRLYSLNPYQRELEIFRIDDGVKKEFAVEPWAKPSFKVYEHWMVYFRDKEGSWLAGLYPVRPFVVEINAKTGEIVKWGLK